MPTAQRDFGNRQTPPAAQPKPCTAAVIPLEFRRLDEDTLQRWKAMAASLTSGKSDAVRANAMTAVDLMEAELLRRQ